MLFTTTIMSDTSGVFKAYLVIGTFSALQQR